MESTVLGLVSVTTDPNDQTTTGQQLPAVGRKTQKGTRDSKSYKERIKESIENGDVESCNLGNQESKPDSSQSQVFEQHGLQRISLKSTSVPNSDERLYSEEQNQAKSGEKINLTTKPNKN